MKRRRPMKTYLVEETKILDNKIADVTPNNIAWFSIKKLCVGKKPCVKMRR